VIKYEQVVFRQVVRVGALPHIYDSVTPDGVAGCAVVRIRYFAESTEVGFLLASPAAEEDPVISQSPREINALSLTRSSADNSYSQGLLWSQHKHVYLERSYSHYHL
jgi:hypothetical protein